jgi:acetyl-CoA C-acetyltransferase
LRDSVISLKENFDEQHRSGRNPVLCPHPDGRMQGALSDVAATDLGATAVKAAVERSGVSGDAIERIYMGCVLPAGLGQAPARQAAIKAGLPKSVQATTVNKVCGSGMQTVIMGAEAIAAGSLDYVVAGGMESMTNAPYILKKHRSGARIGHDTAYDHMFLDGLEDAYEPGRAMGTFAQETADEYQLTREAQDAYSIESLRRAQEAIATGAFASEIVPVTVVSRAGETIVDTDEAARQGPPRQNPDFEARLCQGWHDHRGDLLVDFGRCRSAGAVASIDRRRQWTEARGAHRFARRARAGASGIYHRPGWRNQQMSRQGRLEHRRCRPVRSQRSLCLRRDVRDARPRHPA